MPSIFTLADQLANPDLEQSLLAAIHTNQDAYWETLDVLYPEVFSTHRQAFEELAVAIEKGSALPPIEGKPAEDPMAAAWELAELYKKRLLADLGQDLLEAARGDAPAVDLIAQFEERLMRIQRTDKELRAGRLFWAIEQLPEVLRQVEERRQTWEETGKAIPGLPTGIERLDLLLGGLNDGMIILAGSPGVGKTTLALQIATAVAKETPVVYVTFENSPNNLILKVLAAKAGVPLIGIQRGLVDPQVLKWAAEWWKPMAGRLAFIEGSSRLTTAQVQAGARQAMNRHKADRCLVIVDYLQLWAKMSIDLRSVGAVRERVESLGAELRELAMRLSSPVLALSSQNRAQGDYGNGKGAAALDSLKESGDLEYMADVVMFLTPARDRQARAPARAVDLTLAKHRDGDTGRIELIFRPDVATFREEFEE